MQTTRDSQTARGRLLALFFCGCATLLGGCPSNATVNDPGNPPPDPTIDGLYLFTGSSGAFPMRGTLTFEQQGDTVRVLNTVYFNSNDRSLKGEATLSGNTLTITLVPVNNDMDFHADCVFVFSADRNTFQVSFADTNGDNGPLGSYTGTRQ